jgi:hypothetical protein
MTYKWIYAAIGAPMWERTVEQAEQAVMFYDLDGPSHEPPPMSDLDCLRLSDSLSKKVIITK